MNDAGNATFVMMEGQVSLAVRAGRRWRQAARAIGVVQTRMLMLLIYLVAVLPVGLVFRLRRDPLHLKQPAGTNWTACPDEEATIERARQQF